MQGHEEVLSSAVALQGPKCTFPLHQLVDKIACQSLSGLGSLHISFNLVLDTNAFVLILQ